MLISPHIFELQDMLENDVIQLDHMFISSIVFDIIKVSAAEATNLIFKEKNKSYCSGDIIFASQRDKTAWEFEINQLPS